MGNSEQRKTWKNRYEEITELGEGGNAKVYKVKEKITGNNYALKFLTNSSSEKKKRFINEIRVMKNICNDIEGVLPIINYSDEDFWYIMPIATPAIQYIKEKKLGIQNIVQDIMELCVTIEKIHEQDVTHRDIKPSNIYYYKGRMYLGDFGLVGIYSDEDDITKSDRALGAIFTIAPEMKRNPKVADGKKADVFSLAKTLWMFLTEDEKGFDGQYNNADSLCALKNYDKYKTVHLVELEELLKEATDSSPDKRPSISEFKRKLENWKTIFNDFDKSQASDWRSLNIQIANSGLIESASWRTTPKIIRVLNMMAESNAYNHMLLSSFGGTDFSYAKNSNEEGCIELYDSNNWCYIVKPKKLSFESFEKYRWNYYLLECEKLSPILEDNNDLEYEVLVEDYPGNYVSARYSNYGVYDYDTGTPYPDGYRTVFRYIKGKFLFVMASSPYNRIMSTYDGRHGEYDSEKFQEYISEMIEKYSLIYNQWRQYPQTSQYSEEDLEIKILNSDIFRRKLSSFVEPDIDNINEINNMEKTEEFVRSHFENWNFIDMISNITRKESPRAKFAFKFNVSNLRYLFDNTLDYYMCKDGKIRNIDPFMDDRCFFIYDRDFACQKQNDLNARITEILRENKLLSKDNTANSFFSVHFFKHGNPIHIFTKQEIKEKMENADDRENNQLVIDENGFVQISKHITYSKLFPVRLEMWEAGNCYVGKYSKLLTLDENYLLALQGFLDYLRTGKKQFSDCLSDNFRESEMIEEIRKIIDN